MHMVEINEELLGLEDFKKIITNLQAKNKELEERYVKEKKDSEDRMKKLNETIQMHRETLDKVRFPGVNRDELPGNDIIASTLGIGQEELDFYLDKYPEKYLLRIEAAASTHIQALKTQLRDSEVDISGQSIIELLESLNETFFSKYKSEVDMDDDFIPALIEARSIFDKIWNQYPIHKRYLADISVIQDCRMSAYLHYRDKLDASNELTVKIEKEEESPDVAELKDAVASMRLELDKLKSEKKLKEDKEAEVLADKDQQELASIGSDEISEETSEEGEETEEKTEGSEEAPKRGRPRRRD